MASGNVWSNGTDDINNSTEHSSGLNIDDTLKQALPNFWASYTVKDSSKSLHQPNQNRSYHNHVKGAEIPRQDLDYFSSFFTSQPSHSQAESHGLKTVLRQRDCIPSNPASLDESLQTQLMSRQRNLTSSNPSVEETLQAHLSQISRASMAEVQNAANMTQIPKQPAGLSGPFCSGRNERNSHGSSAFHQRYCESGPSITKSSMNMRPQANAFHSSRSGSGLINMKLLQNSLVDSSHRDDLLHQNSTSNASTEKLMPQSVSATNSPQMVATVPVHSSYVPHPQVPRSIMNPLRILTSSGSTG